MKERYDEKRFKLELFTIAMKNCDKKTKQDEIVKSFEAWEKYCKSKQRRLKVILMVLVSLIIVLLIALIA